MSSSDDLEKERIHTAYQNHPDVDNRYSWFNLAHLLMIQQIHCCLLKILSQKGIHTFENFQKKFLSNLIIHMIFQICCL